MPPSPTTLHYLASLGITSTAFLAGQTAACTYLLLPSILLSPAPLLLRQWRRAYTTSRTLIFPASVLLSTLFAYLSYTFHTSVLPSARWRAKLFFLAAALPLLDIPWTLLLMAPIHRELLGRTWKGHEKGVPILADMDVEAQRQGQVEGKRMGFREVAKVAAGGREEREGLSSHQLVDVWGWLNLGRAGVMVVGAACAVVGVVGV